MSDYQTYQDRMEWEKTSPDGFVAKAVERACLQVETTAKVLMLTPGSGRLYEPGKYTYYSHKTMKWYAWERTLPTHRASAPGQPASSDSGVALSKIIHKLNYGGSAVTGEVIIDTDYSLYFEIGTRLMEARPVLQPALSSLNGRTL